MILAPDVPPAAYVFPFVNVIGGDPVMELAVFG